MCHDNVAHLTLIGYCLTPDKHINLVFSSSFKRFVLTTVMGKELNQLTDKERELLINDYLTALLVKGSSLGAFVLTDNYAKEVLKILPDDMKGEDILDCLYLVYKKDRHQKEISAD